MSISSLSDSSPGAIDIRQSRGFSDQLTITFAFLRENFQQLGKSVIYIAGPVLLGGCILLAILFTVSADDITAVERSGLFYLLAVLAIIPLIFAWLMLVAIVNNYVFLYLEGNGERIEVQDVWLATKENFGRVVATAFGLGGIWIGLNFVIGIASVIPFVGLLVNFGYLFLVIYFSVALMPLYTVRLQENFKVYESISRCRELVRDNWWMTFGLLLVTGGIASLLFYGVGGATYMLSKWFIELWNPSAITESHLLILQIIVVPVAGAGIVFYIVPVLASVLHYFNLVEKLDGVGVLERIEQLGGDDVSSLSLPADTTG